MNMRRAFYRGALLQKIMISSKNIFMELDAFWRIFNEACERGTKLLRSENTFIESTNSLSMNGDAMEFFNEHFSKESIEGRILCKLMSEGGQK